MKQFDLQGNEYDCNIEFPTDITDVSFRFSKDALFKSWQDEALRHREEILQLKDQLQQKENIIKEVREELNKIDSATYQGDTDKKTYYKYEQTRIQKLLETLDKENKQ